MQSQHHFISHPPPKKTKKAPPFQTALEEVGHKVVAALRHIIEWMSIPVTETQWKLSVASDSRMLKCTHWLWLPNASIPWACLIHLPCFGPLGIFSLKKPPKITQQLFGFVNNKVATMIWLVRWLYRFYFLFIWDVVERVVRTVWLVVDKEVGEPKSKLLLREPRREPLLEPVLDPGAEAKL